MDKLKEPRYRGYLIAGIGGIVGFISFFLSYLTYTFVANVSNPYASPGFNGSQIGGWLWLEFIASLLAIGVPALLIYRSNPFGLSTMPVEKQIRYGIFTIIGTGAVALFIHIIFAVNLNSVIVDWNGSPLTYIPGSNTVSLSVGYWFYVIAALAMLGGGIYAFRMIGTIIAQPWSYPSQSSQYPPYAQPYQPGSQSLYGQSPYPMGDQPPYPPYPAPYPQADQQQYQPTELKQPYPQTGPQQYPPTELQQPYPQTGPQYQPYPQTGQQYQPTELKQPPYPPQPYPPQQMPPS